MLPLIEFCESNLRQGTQSVYDALENRDDVDVLTYGCLSECTFCARNLFCMFEGERIGAQTPTELLAKIEEKIQEWNDFFA